MYCLQQFSVFQGNRQKMHLQYLPGSEKQDLISCQKHNTKTDKSLSYRF